MFWWVSSRLRLVSRFRSLSTPESRMIRSGRNLRATSRSSSSSRASQTIPIPPRPKILINVKRPKTFCPPANSRNVTSATSPKPSLATPEAYTSSTLKGSLNDTAHLCVRPEFLIEGFCVNASEKDGAWLESADGRQHTLQSSCSLGRATVNTIVLESPKISRRHALIHLQNIGEFWLIDFGSSNGTFLNKRRIHQSVRLSDGDQIAAKPQNAKRGIGGASRRLDLHL